MMGTMHSIRNASEKKQSDYKILNEIYEGTVFADIIKDVDGIRSRIIYRNSCTTNSVHKDNSPRYHLGSS